MTDSRHRTVAWLGRYIQRCLLAGGLLCLGGCLHLQLGGAVTEATLTVTPLRDPASIIEQVSTPSLAGVRDEDGPARWDGRRDIGRFVFLGNVILDESRYDPDTLYLVTAYGGRDQDPDADNALDGNPAPVNGQWHAILTGEQLTRGKVSPLTGSWNSILSTWTTPASGPSWIVSRA